MILALTAAGCAGGYHVERSVDADGVAVDRMVGNEIGIEGEGEYSEYAIAGSRMDLAGVEEQCYLDAVRHSGSVRPPTYYLLLSYSGPRDLHIVNRRSLTLVIDENASVTLSGRGDVERKAEEVNKTYTESFYYLVPAEVLVRIADAKKVDVLVAGQEFELKCYFLDRNFDNFRRFVKQFVAWAK